MSVSSNNRTGTGDQQHEGESGYSSGSDNGEDPHHLNVINEQFHGQQQQRIEEEEEENGGQEQQQIRGDLIIQTDLPPIKESITTGTQTELDPNVQEAVLLARDLLRHYNKNDDYHHQSKLPSWRQPFRSSHADVLLQLVNEILEKHGPVYTSMVKNLLQAQTVKIATLKVICDEVFGGDSDKNISWGKIVALYALCAELGRQSKDTSYWQVLYACDFIGTYTGEKTSQWIRKQGGWGALKSAMPPKNYLEHAVWKGLLMTGLGLGVVATVIKVVR